MERCLPKLAEQTDTERKPIVPPPPVEVSSSQDEPEVRFGGSTTLVFYAHCLQARLGGLNATDNKDRYTPLQELETAFRLFDWSAYNERFNVRAGRMGAHAPALHCPRWPHQLARQHPCLARLAHIIVSCHR